MKHLPLILAALLLFAAGFETHRHYYTPAPADTTSAPPETSLVEIPILPPAPRWAQATLDSIVAESLQALLEQLPTYRDTLRDTLIDTLTTPVPVAQTDSAQTLGYTDSTTGRFVPQGTLRAWYVYPPYDGFIFDWQPTPPPRFDIHHTQYIQTPESSAWFTRVWNDPWVRFGAGILVGWYTTKTIYDIARRD